jgi:tRNA G46 methylase TrmB
MKKAELIEKIMQKKDFSGLPKKDVELVFDKFDKEDYLDEEKIKLSRDLLRKMYTAFMSQKLLSVRDKNEDWFLKKHISTKERFEFYSELYEKLLKDFNGKITIFDLGAGINGFSYSYLKKLNPNISYVGVEAVGQLVDLVNNYFEKNTLNALAIHESLFNISNILKILKKRNGKKVVFLFKTLDSLEMLQRDYSKELLKKIVPAVDEVIVSFATRSLVSRKKFNVRRNWIIDFIENNFFVSDRFEIGNEIYIVFSKKQKTL